ncbi:hypothetical protein [Spirosoma arcticum]
MQPATTSSTNYDLVEQFMAYLLTLSSTEYTQFFCETCYERLDTPLECRPTSPFHENTGTCSHCKRCDDVSSPHMNRFLAERGLYLKDSPYLVEFGQCEGNQTASLILNWLIPTGYAHERWKDKHHNEEAQFSWVKYGRKLEKEVHRSSFLSETSKALLIAFYTHRYRADRFTPDPTEDKPTPVLLTQSEPAVSEYLPISTFARFKAFVANTLKGWKGEGI